MRYEACEQSLGIPAYGQHHRNHSHKQQRKLCSVPAELCHWYVLLKVCEKQGKLYKEAYSRSYAVKFRISTTTQI